MFTSEIQFNLIPFAINNIMQTWNILILILYLHHIFPLLIKPIAMNARKNINEKLVCINLFTKRLAVLCLKKNAKKKGLQK